MDHVTAMGNVLHETNRVVGAIEPDQLDNPSPCDEWTVRDLLNHITAGANVFAVCVRDGSVSDEQLGAIMVGDNLGDDYRGAFRDASENAITAFGEPGAVDRMVTLPFGTMPAKAALSIAIFDVTIHTWDLARATGQQLQLDDDTLTLAYELAVPMMDGMRTNGVVAEAVEISTDAPLDDRLAALAGRRP
jgi:uncharacterized protein (TIGR03086 family)